MNIGSVVGENGVAVDGESINERVVKHIRAFSVHHMAEITATLSEEISKANGPATGEVFSQEVERICQAFVLANEMLLAFRRKWDAWDQRDGGHNDNTIIPKLTHSHHIKEIS